MERDESVDCLIEHNYVNEKKKFCIKSGYILREIAGEYVIVPVDEECLITNAVMMPNDSAVFLWKAFQQPASIEEVVRKVLLEYDEVEAVIRKAVQRFVNDALQYRILEGVD